METRQSFRKAPRYSLRWAWSVFYSLESTYTRATETALHLLGLSPRNAVLLLANGETSWRPLKHIIHHIDKFGLGEGLDGLIHAFQAGHREIPLCQIREIPLLTAGSGGITLKKPGFQGGFRPKAYSAVGRNRPYAPDCFWSDPAWLRRGLECSSDIPNPTRTQNVNS